MTGTLAIARIRLQSTTFESFMGATYGAIHGTTHVQVGGHMSTMHSPQDPIFFSHHAFIDKLWSVWQDCHDAHEDEAKMFVGM
jgi:tyrosinase